MPITLHDAFKAWDFGAAILGFTTPGNTLPEVCSVIHFLYYKFSSIADFAWRFRKNALRFNYD